MPEKNRFHDLFWRCARYFWAVIINKQDMWTGGLTCTERAGRLSYVPLNSLEGALRGGGECIPARWLAEDGGLGMLMGGWLSVTDRKNNLQHSECSCYQNFGQKLVLKMLIMKRKVWVHFIQTPFLPHGNDLSAGCFLVKMKTFVQTNFLFISYVLWVLGSRDLH